MYWLAPSPDVSGKEPNFATWENGFSESEISNVISLGEARSLADGIVGGGANAVKDEIVRKSQVSWIEHSNDTSWLYDKLAWIARNLNGQFFKFDLAGFAEQFQYTVYRNGGDHYDWHIDKGEIGGAVPRKLSLVIQLTDPSEYEGGDFEFLMGNNPTKMERRKGLVVAFPSWVLHRVT